MTPLSYLLVVGAFVGGALASDTCAESGTCADEATLLQGLAKVRADSLTTFETAQPENQCTGKYEAEDAKIVGGAVKTHHPGFSGSGFVDYIWKNTAYIEWTVNSCSGGDATLSFRYALGYGNRPLEVKVNGEVVESSLDFHGTGSWNTWGLAPPVEVQLQAGTNVVKLTAAGNSGGNVDSLEINSTADAAADEGAQTGPSAELEQFTPDQADWSSTFQSKHEQSSNTGHDPDGVFWISHESWVEWDGSTTYNPSEMSRAEFYAAICPTGDIIRGIREVFYEHAPFADNNNPTKAEVDEWHRIAINHVRALVGYTDPDRQVQKDHCMFARALWQQQRQRSTQWDEDYPGDGSVDTAAGPCTGGTNPHCGASFFPSAEDQAEFLPPGHAACGPEPGAEGIFSASKSNIPWSIKWSRAICGTIGSEGFWGGHTGPFFHREKFGFSFWDDEPGNFQSNAVLTGKWTGNLMPGLYEQPR